MSRMAVERHAHQQAQAIAVRLEKRLNGYVVRDVMSPRREGNAMAARPRPKRCRMWYIWINMIEVRVWLCGPCANWLVA